MWSCLESPRPVRWTCTGARHRPQGRDPGTSARHPSSPRPPTTPGPAWEAVSPRPRGGALARAGEGAIFNHMVEYLDTTFAALSHHTRRDILARLSLGESTVGDIAAAYDVSLNAVSKHLKVLENAGLVTRRVEGRVHHIGLEPEPLRTASEWIEFYRGFWEERLDALDEFLARKKGAQRGARHPHHPKNRGHPR